MTTTTTEQTESRPSLTSQRMRRVLKWLDLWGARLLPKGLYARALIIIIAPIVLLQSVLIYLIMERHWEYVTKHLSRATVQDISTLVSIYENYPHRRKHTRLTDIARRDLGLVVKIVPRGKLPPPHPRPFFGRFDRILSKLIRAKINKPFWIDTVGNSKTVEIRIKLDGAVMKVLVRRSQTYASNTLIFMTGMLTTALILITVAVMFLRNQIRPVLSLAQAAECFGRGQPAPKDFRIRGAREVRQAAEAFVDMRNRIERHVEQRTTMLAGVSHDLRTVLTRFRLQLAMLKPGAEVDELVGDVDEMQAMLEDYLAFARGDSGEEAQETDIRTLLSDVHASFSSQHPGRQLTLSMPEEPVTLTVRRNVFKRAVMNLVSNAVRFGSQVAISAALKRRNVVVIVEDNGPGVPAEKREDVFRPFYSLDTARNQNIKSTGLGLAISRDFIRAHGGEIHLGNSRMGGLKATIRIPL